MSDLAGLTAPFDTYTHLERSMGFRLMWSAANIEYNSDNFHNFDWDDYRGESMEWANNYETQDGENN